MLKKNSFQLVVFYAAVVLFIFSGPVLAAGLGGGGLPWDSWITRVLQSFTGPIAFLFSVVAFIGCGVALAMGSDFSTWIKGVLGACFGVSVIVGAQNIVSMVFSGAVIPEGMVLSLL